MITFSVVTITYNAEDVLQPTLDSVLMQDYMFMLNILIIDGASTDNTVSIAEAYKASVRWGWEWARREDKERTWWRTLPLLWTKDCSRRLVIMLFFSECWGPFSGTWKHFDKVALAAEVGTVKSYRLSSLVIDIIDSKGNFPLSSSAQSTRTTHMALRSVMVCWCAIRRFMHEQI